MRRKIYGIFVAGGSGTRMGGDTPKQFLLLDGRPILQCTIERFLEAEPDMKVITVLPKAHFQTWKDLCAVHSFHCPQTLVAGGLTRFHSVQNALRKVPEGAIVSIHDGVRPLVSADLVRRMLERMQSGECRALLPVIPVVDTLRSTDPAAPDPDRAKVVAVQTPQMFRSEDIKAAYTQAYDLSFTDDASVAARKEIPLAFEAGERFNLKITTPEDLVLAEAILTRR
ncbi:MAG: 2-C-methyl-D-erythritol 4-phosphate cytidylyltransferase [Bacteroidales bacterium]|nr:2-C-methyl-D-erythritol 4-phosphate cytidylyltransferase [Bacteroidales bacterium]MBR6876303.1 2-C-methyl-D-erythritol 4-phosphate cytidylyltransferase [Bacteroidales bacterium]